MEGVCESRKLMDDDWLAIIVIDVCVCWVVSIVFHRVPCRLIVPLDVYSGDQHKAQNSIMLCCIFIFYLFFPSFRAPVRVGLSLPWWPVDRPPVYVQVYVPVHKPGT